MMGRFCSRQCSAYGTPRPCPDRMRSRTGSPRRCPAKLGLGIGRWDLAGRLGRPRLTIPTPSTGTTPRAESWNVTRALEAYYAAVRFNKLATKGRRYYPDPRDANSRGSATRLHKTRRRPRARIASVTRGHSAGPLDRRVDGSVCLCRGQSRATLAGDRSCYRLRGRRPYGSERRTMEIRTGLASAPGGAR